MTPLFAALAIGIALASLVTFLAFGLDKLLARRDLRRVPERTLLLLAALGGSPGALLARRVFRHKTVKEPFGSRFRRVVGVQLALVAAAIVLIAARGLAG